ncbi:MAG: tyrosine-type recombinase/integrase [Candidatus Limnocylindrales bacterium]
MPAPPQGGPRATGGRAKRLLRRSCTRPNSDRRRVPARQRRASKGATAPRAAVGARTRTGSSSRTASALPSTTGRSGARSEVRVRQAGVPRIRFHDLRHAFATLLFDEVEELGSIAAALGHTSVDTTNLEMTPRPGDVSAATGVELLQARLFRVLDDLAAGRSRQRRPTGSRGRRDATSPWSRPR